MENIFTKEELINVILEFEWEMFTDVQNIGGRASCQDDFETFEIMRRSQFNSWNNFLLETYLADVLEAKSQDRNLLSEKYGYMMEYSSPSEFESIKDSLPPRSEEKKKLVRTLTDMHLQWRSELKEKYPKLIGKGRPDRIEDEFPGVVSMESYTLGELSTMSERSLQIYLDYANQLKESNVNMAELILESTVKMYGFASLEEAENR